MTPVGRPEVGPTIQIRLTEETLATLDAIAARRSISRAEVVRQLVEVGIRHQADLLDAVDYAAYLRERMLASGIRTTAELAQRTGVNQSTISRWMLGRTKPDARGREQVETALNDATS